MNSIEAIYWLRVVYILWLGSTVDDNDDDGDNNNG